MQEVKQNYDRLMTEYFKGRSRQKLLLHCCCAPCASSVTERLLALCDVTLYFYNPNIMPCQEYDKRLDELKRLAKALDVPLVYETYDNDEFTTRIIGLENEKEGGKRCEECFFIRLNKTALTAKKDGFDCFTSTLTVSPHKNSTLVNLAGLKAAETIGISWLPSDFKKNNGYLRSLELSKQYGFYRQDYCGCRL